MSTSPRPRIAGLDGLRGFALLLVLVFHLWPERLPAGFVGVTLFFALSGFLITGILVHEVERTGTVSLRAFWARRLRRLVPVSLLTLLLVTVVWSAAGWMTRDIHRDILFSLIQAANWGRILAGQSYSLGGALSPVLHYWSLAIEEQLYLVLPIVLWLCRTRRWARRVLVLALLLSIVSVVMTSGSASQSYYSTFSRAGELLVGALAATIVGHRTWRRTSTRVVAAVVFVAGVGVLVWVALHVHVDDRVVGRGLLLACGAVSTAAIVAVSGWPALGRIVDWRPLAWLGGVSYAAYVVHWPILQALRHSSLDPRWVPWCTLAVTMLVAAASGRWYEDPIRTRRVSSRALLVGGGIVLVTLLLVVQVVGVPSSRFDFEAAQRQAEQNLSTTATASTAPASTGQGGTVPSSATGTPQPTDVTLPGEPARISFFGDSKALLLEQGIANRGFSGVDVVPGFTPLGCPTGRGGRLRRDPGGDSADVGSQCDWPSKLLDVTRQWTAPADVAFVWSGTWDVADRQIPALGDAWTDIRDPKYRAWMLSEMVALTDVLTVEAKVTRVVWLTLPVMTRAYSERYPIWNDLLLELKAARPSIELIDVNAWVTAQSDARRLLPDGVHPTWGHDTPADNTAAEIGAACLIPLLSTAPSTASGSGSPLIPCAGTSTSSPAP